MKKEVLDRKERKRKRRFQKEEKVYQHTSIVKGRTIEGNSSKLLPLGRVGMNS